jgi:hypothetical protein
MMFVMDCEDFNEDLLLPHASNFWMVPPEYDDSGATKTLNVVAVSFNVDSYPEANRDTMVHFISKIVSEQPNVRLILFPEVTLGYYHGASNSSEYCFCNMV